MKFFIILIETLGQVIVMAVAADNEHEASYFCYNVLKESSGRVVTAEIDETEYTNLIRYSKLCNKLSKCRFRNSECPTLDVIDKSSTVYIIASGKTHPQSLFKE